MRVKVIKGFSNETLGRHEVDAVLSLDKDVAERLIADGYVAASTAPVTAEAAPIDAEPVDAPRVTSATPRAAAKKAR